MPRKPTIRHPMPDLMALAKSLKSDVWIRFMRRAQKATLIEWRDRRDPPGVMARFEKAGAGFYGFMQRTMTTNKRKGFAPDFVNTGSTRELLSARRPRSINNGGADVMTRMSIGGGALNLLSNVPSTVVTRTQGMRTVEVGGYQGHRNGKTWTVNPHSATRASTTVTKRIDHRNYSAEFAALTQDIPWLENRTAEIFREIIRKSVLTKTGKIKSSMLEEMDNVN